MADIDEHDAGRPAASMAITIGDIIRLWSGTREDTLHVAVLKHTRARYMIYGATYAWEFCRPDSATAMRSWLDNKQIENWHHTHAGYGDHPWLT